MPPPPAPAPSGSSTSTERSSNNPSRYSSRNVWRVDSLADSPQMKSSTLLSTTSSTSFLSVLRILILVMVMPMSIRSLMIMSTSLPWNPTSVNLVASTLMKGESVIFARRRAISVLPQPVGPIIRMFLGTMSSRRDGCTRCRRHRLRSATAHARLASACPMMYLSSSSTVLDGVRPNISELASSNASVSVVALCADSLAVVGGGGGGGGGGGESAVGGGLSKTSLSASPAVMRRMVTKPRSAAVGAATAEAAAEEWVCKWDASC
mmetsp:Transcript_33674/g.82607  ORF Transcript_33674/g.82607 Transcript_33674/m.82607 type:complete len:264 (-) Transcript_33674:155-946(-)